MMLPTLWPVDSSATAGQKKYFLWKRWRKSNETDSGVGADDSVSIAGDIFTGAGRNKPIDRDGGMRNCGDAVSVYDSHGRFQCRGQIISRYYGRHSQFYDVDTGDELERMVPAARIRTAYQPMKDEEPKHIFDEV